MKQVQFDIPPSINSGHRRGRGSGATNICAHGRSESLCCRSCGRLLSRNKTLHSRRSRRTDFRVLGHRPVLGQAEAKHNPRGARAGLRRESKRTASSRIWCRLCCVMAKRLDPKRCASASPPSLKQEHNGARNHDRKAEDGSCRSLAGQRPQAPGLLLCIQYEKPLRSSRIALHCDLWRNFCKRAD